MVLDLTDRLQSEKPSIKVGGKVYEINNTGKFLLKLAELEKNKGSEVDIMNLLLGKENFEEILDHTGMDKIKILVAYVAGLAQGQSEKEIEKSLALDTPSKK